MPKTIRAVCLIAAVAVPGTLPGQALPSPSELIAKAVAAKSAEDKRATKYTFREDRTDAQLDKNGVASPPTTKTYDHIMLEGENYRKLVLVDGKPLDAKAQKKAEEDLEKTRSERRRNPLSLHRSISLSGLDVLERLFDNKVTGEEVVLGRQTWRMESEPKSGCKPANKEEEQALGARHVSWFDKEDGMRIRQHDEYIHPANGFQPGTVVDWEYAKMGEDWLPGTLRVRADIKSMPGVRGRVESRQLFYHYKRFVVESSLVPE